MAAVSAFSAYRVSGVARELHTVSGDYLRILRCIESMGMHALEQEVHFSRLVRFHETKHAVPPSLLQREDRGLLQRGKLVDAEIKECRRLLTNTA